MWTEQTCFAVRIGFVASPAKHSRRYRRQVPGEGQLFTLLVEWDSQLPTGPNREVRAALLTSVDLMHTGIHADSSHLIVPLPLMSIL